MGRLSTTGICLIVIVVITVAALLAQLCYVLWCRRRFHRQNLSDEILSVSASSTTNDRYNCTSDHISASKELLYFFCWKNQSRIGPTTTTATPPPPFLSSTAPDASPDTGDLMKWPGVYGPSRALFTIKEEEIRDQELEYYMSTDENINNSSSSSDQQKKKTKTRVSLEEHFEVVPVPDQDPPEIVVVPTEMETPFSTPCDSPLYYYTPSSSPPREIQERRVGGDLSCAPETDVSVAVEVGELVL